MTITLDIQGMDRLKGKVVRLKTLDRHLRPAMKRATDLVKGKMAKEPGAIPPGHWRANTTPRQRRWFFAALREGRVRGGRTHTYSRSWQVDITGVGGDITGRVFNPVAYGPYVGSKSGQAAFLRNRWPADQDVVDETQPEIQRDFDDAIQRIIDEG